MAATLPFPQSKIDQLLSVLNLSKPKDISRVGKFGMKDAQDVFDFIRSSAGKSIIAEVDEKKATTEKLQEHALLMGFTKLALMEQLRGLLLSWFLEDKIDEKAYREAIRRYQEEDTHTTKQESSNQWKFEPIPYPLQSQMLLDLLRQYDDAIKNLLGEQSLTDADIAELEANLAMAAELDREMDDRFEDFANELEEFEQSLEAALPNFDAQIEALTKALEEGAETIAGLLENAAPVAIGRYMQQHMQLAILQHKNEVAQGEKTMVDEDGNEVSSYGEADYIVDKGETIAKLPNGELCLLKPGQSLESVQRDPEAQKQAKNYFEQKKPQMMSAKKVLRQHYNQEKTAQQESVALMQAQLAAKKNEKAQRQEQLGLVQAARNSANDSQTRVQAQLKMKPPAPSSSPLPAKGQEVTAPTPRPTPRPRPTIDTNYYATQAKLLHDKQQLTPANIQRLAQQAPGSAAARLFAAQYFAKNIGVGMAPIPLATMQSLLQKANLPYTSAVMNTAQSKLKAGADAKAQAVKEYAADKKEVLTEEQREAKEQAASYESPRPSPYKKSPYE